MHRNFAVVTIFTSVFCSLSCGAVDLRLASALTWVKRTSIVLVVFTLVQRFLQNRSMLLSVSWRLLWSLVRHFDALYALMSSANCDRMAARVHGSALGVMYSLDLMRCFGCGMYDTYRL